MIPKIIHYCWFGGKALSDDALRFIDSWKRFCPDYTFVCWDESNFDITSNLYCQQAYEAKKWAFVTDYVRLKVLYDYGGVYMDTDVEMKKDITPLLEYNWFSGYELDNRIPTGTMGASPQNSLIKLLLEDYNELLFYKDDGKYDLTTNVTRITNTIIKKYGLNLNGEETVFGNRYILLPFDYLCAKSYLNGKIYKTDNTYTIHHFKGSWLNERTKFKKNIKMFLRNVIGDKNFELIKRHLEK